MLMPPSIACRCCCTFGQSKKLYIEKRDAMARKVKGSMAEARAANLAAVQEKLKRVRNTFADIRRQVGY